MSDFSSSSSSMASLDTNSITSDLEDLKSIITDDIFQNDSFKVSYCWAHVQKVPKIRNQGNQKLYVAYFKMILKLQIKEEYENPQNNNQNLERTVVPKFRPLSKNRPGRKAKLADSELSPAELEKREVRRVRNKQAARRCRQRRLEKTYNLEQKVSSNDRNFRGIENA